MKDQKKPLKSEAKDGPLAIGEKIEFDKIIKSYVDTRFGAAVSVKFVKDRKIVRSTFAGRGMLDFLDNNKGATSITLVDKIADGELTYNIYE